MTSSELYSGHSHTFDIGIAMELGINAAIVFNHIVYWLRINASKKDAKLIDGKIWMYETQEEIACTLGYLTIDQVKKAMIKLLESGLLIKNNFNKNPFNHTNWYTTKDQSIIFKGIKNSNISYESAIRHDQECQAALSTEPDGTLLYIQKENIQKEKQEEQQQQQDAAAVKKNISCDSIKYYSPGGKEKFISSSEIFTYFLKHPFKTQTIQQAIEIVKNKNEPIGNVLKLLEIICLDIENKSKNHENTKSDYKKTTHGIPKRNDPPGKNPWAEELKNKKNRD